MIRRALWLPALILALVACTGDDDGAADPDPTDSSTSAPTSTSASTTSEPTSELGEIVEAAGKVELDIDVPRRVPAAPFTWVIEVTNVTEEAVVVTFPTAQPGDVRLLRSDELVHRWSDGKFFATVVTQRTIPAGETITVELTDDLSGVEPGFYTLVAELEVHGPPESHEQSVRVVTAG